MGARKKVICKNIIQIREKQWFCAQKFRNNGHIKDQIEPKRKGIQFCNLY